MNGRILVLNAGSSSIKFSLHDAAEPRRLIARGEVEDVHAAARFAARDGEGRTIAERAWAAGVVPGHDGALAAILEWIDAFAALDRLAAVGHRVVHGGARHDRPVRIDDDVLDELRALIPLAPLHQPHNVAAIDAMRRRAPGLVQVACFDTSFHRTQPPLAQAFALPRRITDLGVRRYGFHGLSYESVCAVLGEHDAAATRGKVVILHLGNGASMCAVSAGASVATTMGFTAADGLPMGTRCGALDPGVMLYFMTTLGMSAREIERLIYHESGLLGVSGISGDMRALEASDDPRARFAIDLFTYRIGRELGSLAAAMGGLDAIVFTAGIGQHSAAVRAQVCRAAAWLDIDLDAAANLGGGPRISSPSSRTRAWVVPADEETMIAQHTRRAIESR